MLAASALYPSALVEARLPSYRRRHGERYQGRRFAHSDRRRQEILVSVHPRGAAIALVLPFMMRHVRSRGSRRDVRFQPGRVGAGDVPQLRLRSAGLLG
jgi:hypothetical protein